jgi:methionyl aminopeptidase
VTAETSGDAIRGVARTARIVSRVLDSVRRAVVHGTTSGDLDSLVRSSLARFDAVPAMLGYADDLSASRADPPFPAALSVCINDEIMGGSDPNRVLRAGDLVTADLAAGSRGWHADAAITWVIPGCQADPDRVIRRASLAAASAAVTKAGVDAIEPGVLWSVVTAAMAAEAARRGVAVWAGYDGNGIGRSMHQPPRLPARPDDRPELQTRPLEPGMVITVEPVVSWEGGRQESVRSGWLDRTADGSDACFTEVTVAIGSRRARALGDGL